VSDTFFDCLNLKMKMLRSFEGSVSIYQLIWHNVSENLIVQL